MNDAAAEYAETVIIATIIISIGAAIVETLWQWWRRR
jgi:hypothetical protein